MNFNREREGEKERVEEIKRDSSYLLVHFTNNCNSQGFAGPEIEAMRFFKVSHMLGAYALGLLPLPSQIH